MLYTLKSKPIRREYNAFHLSETAPTGPALHEIKQCIVFFATPAVFHNIHEICSRIVARTGT